MPLKSIEDIFPLIFDALPVGFYITDIKGNFHYVNNELVKYMEFDSKEELIKEGVIKRYKNTEERRKFLNTLKKYGILRDYEIFLVTKNKKVKKFLISAVLIEDFYIAGIIKEISEILRLEETIKKLYLAVENTEDVIFITDRNGFIEYVNPAFERITGYKYIEVLGKKPNILKSGMHKEKFYKNLWNIISSGKIFKSIIINRKKNKELFHLYQTIIPLKNERGEITNFISIGKDVTEIIKTQEKLEIKLARQRKLNEFLEYLFVEKDIKKVFKKAISIIKDSIDADFIKIMKYLHEENKFILIEGKGWKKGYVGKIKVPADRDSQAGYTLLTDEPVVLADSDKEKRFKLPELLKEHSVKSGMSVLIKKEKEKWGILGVHLKTKRKFELDELEFLKSIANLIGMKLKDIEIEKEKEEYYNKYVFSQKMEAIGRLAGGVAHDINNLLTVVHGLAELSLSYIDKKNPAYEFIEQVIKASYRSAGVIKKLLIFSKKRIEDKRIFNLKDTVLNMKKLLEKMAGENVKLKIDIEDEVYNIYGDEASIEQVIMNLVINAKDAIEEKGEIRIRLRKENKYIILYVEDTGRGIEPEIMDKIFDPFFTTKKEKGTGLGLTVVYDIVKKHEGDIDVISEKGKGTTFIIKLPAYFGKLEDKIEEKITEKGKGEKIIVIEDDDDLLFVLKNILEKYNYQVFTAKNTKQARELFEKENYKFDILITDYILPDGNGISFARDLKKKIPELKIIITSGYLEDLNLEKLKEEGFNFMEKPFSPTKVLNTVNYLLKYNKVNS